MTLTLTSVDTVPAPAPKLCRDCKWAKPDALFSLFGLIKTEPSLYFAKCHLPGTEKPTETNVVTGKAPKTEFWFCSTLRQSSAPEACGPEAKLWEARR